MAVSVGRRAGRAWRLSSLDTFCVILLVAVLARFAFSSTLSGKQVSAWSTVFAAISVQATPFVVLGVAVSTAIAVVVPDAFFARALPSRQSLAVPVAGLSGVLLPGCECGSVPVASALMNRGVGQAPSVAFLLSAPAINPVVLVATAVAFPGHPVVVLARLAASLAAAVLVGWAWQSVGRNIKLPSRRHFGEHDALSKRIRLTGSHDLAQSIGLLAFGAAMTATLKVTVPVDWLERLGGNAVIGLLVLGALAVALAVCSEADAFIAASLTQFSLTARLAFMVIGPAVDLKLIAMQLGTFGPRFTARFVPLAFLTTLVCSVVAGGLLL